MNHAMLTQQFELEQIVISSMRLTHRFEMRGYSLLASCLTLSACLGTSGPDCRDETRSLSADARLSSVVPGSQSGDTAIARFSFYEARNFRTKATAERGATWFVGSGLARSSVTAVHVHEQTSGRLLFNVPLEVVGGSPFVITQIFARRAYTGSVDWDELYQLIGNEGTYVDIHTIDHPNGQLRGTLRPEYPNWRTFTHAYCS